MPLRLILIRHAKSSWSDAGQADHDRPINLRGQEAALRIGGWLRQRGQTLGHVLSSDARRTVETYHQIIAGTGVEANVTYRSDLYHATASEMLGALSEFDDRTITMIGHNPGIGDLATRLASHAPDHSRFRDYPTCATTILDFDEKKWRKIGKHSGKLRAFTVPKDLIDA